MFNITEKENKMKDIWLLDSGSSSHVCCSKRFFTNIESYNSVIKVGDGRELRVEGKGCVEIPIDNDQKVRNIRIEEVLFVPDIKLNLISIGKLAKKGFVIKSVVK